MPGDDGPVTLNRAKLREMFFQYSISGAHVLSLKIAPDTRVYDAVVSTLLRDIEGKSYVETLAGSADKKLREAVRTTKQACEAIVMHGATTPWSRILDVLKEDPGKYYFISGLCLVLPTASAHVFDTRLAASHRVLDEEPVKDEFRMTRTVYLVDANMRGDMVTFIAEQIVSRPEVSFTCVQSDNDKQALARAFVEKAPEQLLICFIEVCCGSANMLHPFYTPLSLTQRTTVEYVLALCFSLAFAALAVIPDERQRLRVTVRFCQYVAFVYRLAAPAVVLSLYTKLACEAFEDAAARVDVDIALAVLRGLIFHDEPFNPHLDLARDALERLLPKAESSPLYADALIVADLIGLVKTPALRLLQVAADACNRNEELFQRFALGFMHPVLLRHFPMDMARMCFLFCIGSDIVQMIPDLSNNLYTYGLYNFFASLHFLRENVTISQRCVIALCASQYDPAEAWVRLSDVVADIMRRDFSVVHMPAMYHVLRVARQLEWDQGDYDRYSVAPWVTHERGITEMWQRVADLAGKVSPWDDETDQQAAFDLVTTLLVACDGFLARACDAQRVAHVAALLDTVDRSPVQNQLVRAFVLYHRAELAARCGDVKRATVLFNLVQIMWPERLQLVLPVFKLALWRVDFPHAYLTLVAEALPVRPLTSSLDTCEEYANFWVDVLCYKMLHTLPDAYRRAQAACIAATGEGNQSFVLNMFRMWWMFTAHRTPTNGAKLDAAPWVPDAACEAVQSFAAVDAATIAQHQSEIDERWKRIESVDVADDWPIVHNVFEPSATERQANLHLLNEYNALLVSIVKQPQQSTAMLVTKSDQGFLTVRHIAASSLLKLAEAGLLNDDI